MNDSGLNELFDETWGEDHRSGEIAVVGRPNVGKSTLINQILGHKIAIVSPKPQTTRKQQLGIYTTDAVQILLIDTPGIHTPRHKLGDYMVEVAEQALRDANVILWVLDTSERPTHEDRIIAEKLAAVPDAQIVLALNKSDMPTAAPLEDYRALVAHVAAYSISAATGDGVPTLIDNLTALLPLGPRYYPADQLSEVNMRFVAAETIREKVMLHTDEEIPHAVAVEIEEYREREDGTHYISATIYVERDSQKGIIIGKGGTMIKRIGMDARLELAESLAAPVYVELHVKVLKNWRSDPRFIQRLGYRLPKKED